MPNLPISGLTPTVMPLATDEIATNQGLMSRKMSRQQFLALPNLDITMSGTPFSVGTVGRSLNSTAVVNMTTFDSIESNQLAIEDGTSWRIDATGGVVTVSPGTGVTLEFYNGSSIVSGAKVLAVGVSATLRKISDTIYRIITNESGGGGGSAGLEIIQRVGETFSFGGTFTSTSFDVAAGDVIVFDLSADTDGGDQIILNIDLGGSLSVVGSVDLTSSAQLAEVISIKGMLTVQSNGDYSLIASSDMRRNASVSRDFNGGQSSSAIVGTESTNIQITDSVFSDEFRLKGYIARVLP